MVSPSLCKLLFASTLTLLSLKTIAGQNHIKEREANSPFIQLYHSLNNKPTMTMSARITIISAEFLGKPYSLGALGEGLQGQYDQAPLYRMDAFDCETYVDTVLALALADNLSLFKRCINQVRYDEGKAQFVHRNHFTCYDWNRNNQQQGFVQDITLSLLDRNKKPVAQLAKAYIDKTQWFKHLKPQAIRLQKNSLKEQSRRLEALHREAEKLSGGFSTVPYIPLSVLFNPSGKPNQYLFKQIPNAAIIEIVRPNWDLTQEIGTHLNISHLGFAIWEKGTLMFRNASSTHQQVIDVPLIDYLHEALKSPTIKGINIQIVPPNPKGLNRCLRR